MPSKKQKPGRTGMPPMTGLYNIQPDGDHDEHHDTVPKLPNTSWVSFVLSTAARNA